MSSLMTCLYRIVFVSLLGLFWMGAQPAELSAWQDDDPVVAKLNQMLEAGQFEAALERANQQLATVLIVRGRALHGLGQYDEAIAAYDAALQITPDVADFILFRAISYGKANRHAEAAQGYQSLVDRGEPSPWVAILLGNSRLQNGEYEPAIAAYKNAERLATEEADARQRAIELTALAMQHYELKIMMDNFVKASSPQETAALTKLMLPDETTLKKIFPNSTHVAAMAAAYAEGAASGEYNIKVPEGRSEVRMKFASSDDLNTGEGTATEMAGGWKALRGEWTAGLYMFDVSFCEPGDPLGMSFDGFVKVDEKWYWLPKAWRAVK